MEQAISSTRVAVFIDAENILIESEKAGMNFQLSSILDRIREEGQIAIASAYGDWTIDPLYKYLEQFRQVELHQVSTNKRGKNTADIMLAVDALEIVLLDHAPDVVVLLTGDRDFVPLVRKIKRYGKPVFGMGVQGSTNRDLREACNTFLYVDEILTYKEAGLQQSRLSGFHLLVRAASILERQGKVAFGSSTRLLMQQLDSTFDPLRLGFDSFKSFVVAADEEKFIHYREPESGVGDFYLKPSDISPDPGYSPRAADDDYDDSAVSLRYDTPEAARDAYRQILLSRKNLPLLSWNDRNNLVNNLWGVFDEIGENGLSVFEMNNKMRQFAFKHGLEVPDLAIIKIIHTLNIAHCFQNDGKIDYFTDRALPLSPVVDVDTALDKMNALYVRGISLGEPNAPLIEEGLALMLFDEVTENSLDLTRKLLKYIRAQWDPGLPVVTQLESGTPDSATPLARPAPLARR